MRLQDHSLPPPILSYVESRGVRRPGCTSILVRQLPRRRPSLQPDPSVPHVLVVPRAVPAARQLREGKPWSPAVYNVRPSPQLTRRLPPLHPSPPRAGGACFWRSHCKGEGPRGRKHNTTCPREPPCCWGATNASGQATCPCCCWEGGRGASGRNGTDLGEPQLWGGGGRAGGEMSQPLSLPHLPVSCQHLLPWAPPQIGGRGPRGAGHTQGGPGGAQRLPHMARRARRGREPAARARGPQAGMARHRVGLHRGAWKPGSEGQAGRSLAWAGQGTGKAQ